MCKPLCVSAVFTVSRCLSVCLSVTFMYCIQTAEFIGKLHSRPGSSIILVFWPQAPVPIPRRTPSAGTQNTLGVGKICDFRLKLPVILETVRDRPMHRRRLGHDRRELCLFYHRGTGANITLWIPGSDLPGGGWGVQPSQWFFWPPESPSILAPGGRF